MIFGQTLTKKDTDIDSIVLIWVTDCLTHDLISGPAFFVKHSSVFVQCAADLICELGSRIPGQYCWHSLRTCTDGRGVCIG